MGFPRLPRFRRAQDAPLIRLTARDQQILTLIHRHRFLRSNHLTSLLPGSRQQILRRLQMLYHSGYLERPRCQIDYYHRGGSRTMVYGLGNKGAGWLKREHSLPFHRLDWPKKSTVQRLSLEHALLVSDVMVAVETACRKRAHIRFHTADELNPATGMDGKFGLFHWKVFGARGRADGVIPDGIFGLEFLNRPRDQNQVWFCLEADRGTMPVFRSRLDQSSFHRKLLAYEATWTQNLHRSLFGCARFRVLTVTTSHDRLKTLRDACTSLERGQGLFLFAEADSLRNTDFLSFNWDTSRADQTATVFD